MYAYEGIGSFLFRLPPDAFRIDWLLGRLAGALQPGDRVVVTEDTTTRGTAARDTTPASELRDLRTADGLRLYARNRLIESRLTPNAISLTGLVLCLTGIYLTLAWVFASWTRPLVVMAIIATLLTLSAIFSFINHCWLKLPTTIGLMVIALAFSIVLIASGSRPSNPGSRRWAHRPRSRSSQHRRRLPRRRRRSSTPCRQALSRRPARDRRPPRWRPAPS